MRLKMAFMIMLGLCFSLLLVSWEGEKHGLIGPVPQAPDYADSTQWYVVDRQGEADIFYIISTETGDHMEGDDTCHYANTRDPLQRLQMEKEMHAVDSFYSGRFNYFSPYYRQLSMQSWATEEMAMARIPLAMSDAVRGWEYYLAHLNHGRPFVLAGFSQGAHALIEILKGMPDSIAQRMVAAYVIGYRVTRQDMEACPYIRPAQGADDTGVTVCFNSVQYPEGEIPVVSGGNQFSINPVNWRTDTVSTPFVMYGRKKNDTLSVHLDPDSRLLIVAGYTGKVFMPVIGRPGNYHSLELKFYYPYIRDNIADRVAAYYRKME